MRWDSSAIRNDSSLLLRRAFGPAVLFFLLLGCDRQPVRSSSIQPNVLLITVDTLRPDALGWVGSPNATPAIDRLAREGFRFPRAVAMVPLTFPSHASLMTGVLPRRLGLRDNGQTLGSQPPTLAQTLRGRGYRTAAFVSGYPLARQFGLDRGFDHYDDRFDAGEGESLERRAPQTTAAAQAWLTSAPAPWFLWVHYYDPHYPYHDSYQAEVMRTDAAIGQLLAAVSTPAAGARPLLTVFAADHGESLGEHGEGTHGFFIYDSTVTVPLILRFPGVIRPGQSRAPVRLIDVMPTMIELLGAPAPNKTDGASFVATLRGQSQQIASAYIESYQPWLSYGWAPLSAMRDRGLKFIAAPRPELYDLDRDPHETQNLYDSDRARRLAVMHRAVRELPPAAAATSRSDPETMAKLRALGYVGGGEDRSEPPTSGLRDPKDSRQLRDLLTEADLLLRGGDSAAAVRKFDEVLQRDPQNRFALLRSAVALASVDRLERAVALMPEQPEARLALARALLREGRPAEAVAQAMEATRLQPRHAAAWADLGTALGRSGKIPEAVKAFERAVELEPQNARLLARLAFAEHAAGRVGGAADHLTRVAAMEGDRFHYAGALGILLDDLGRHAQARPWLAAARPSEPEYEEAKRRLSR